MTSFIAVRLVGKDAALRVTGVRSQAHLFGSTAGPFNTLGGSAMTQVVMTELAFGSVLAYFAGTSYLGWAETGSVVQERFPAIAEDQTPGLHCDRTGVADLFPDADTLRTLNIKELRSKLQLGVDIESEESDLAHVVGSLTGAQLNWIATWLASEGVQA